MIKTDIERAARLIADAGSIVIATGAGMGVDSGLPDFRGNQGFWKAYPVLGREQVDFTAIANPDAFRADVRRAWGFYGHRWELYRRTVPHEGFAILKKWVSAKPGGYQIFTSNVDGQFQKAGFNQNRIYECHGSIHHLQCLEPCSEFLKSADNLEVTVDFHRCRAVSGLPLCPRCGAHMRPNVLMFGDWGWVSKRSNEQYYRLDHWLEFAPAPVVIELGAGTQIQSVRRFSLKVVERYGGSLIRINPNEYEVESERAIGLPLGALDGLKALDRLMGDFAVRDSNGLAGCDA